MIACHACSSSFLSPYVGMVWFLACPHFSLLNGTHDMILLVFPLGGQNIRSIAIWCKPHMLARVLHVKVFLLYKGTIVGFYPFGGP